MPLTGPSKFILPEKLLPGDEIRIIAPSKSMAYLNPEIKNKAVTRFEQLGFKVSFSKNASVTNSKSYTASVQERLDDFHNAFLDKSVKAILTVYGGYHSNQLLDYIDYSLVKNNPKVFCGFSDITALQNAMLSQCGLITYSGPHFSQFGMNEGFDFSLEYFIKAVTNSNILEIIPPDFYCDDDWWRAYPKNRTFKHNEKMLAVNCGQSEGIIIGGNLGVLNLLKGTDYLPRISIGVILFLEDTFNTKREFFAEFDRNLEAIIQCNALKPIKGLVIGRAEDAAQMTLDRWNFLIKNKKTLEKIPVIINADFGHTDPIITFPVGGFCRINASKENCQIEIRER